MIVVRVKLGVEPLQRPESTITNAVTFSLKSSTNTPPALDWSLFQTLNGTDFNRLFFFGLQP